MRHVEMELTGLLALSLRLRVRLPHASASSAFVSVRCSNWNPFENFEKRQIAANLRVFDYLQQASQASDVGSIPIARSINHDDSIVLTPLTPLKRPITQGFLVPRWSQRNELVPTSQP